VRNPPPPQFQRKEISILYGWIEFRVCVIERNVARIKMEMWRKLTADLLTKMTTQFQKNEFKNGFGVSNLLGALIFCYVSDTHRFVASVFILNFAIGLLQWSWRISSTREKTPTKCEWMMFSTSARVTPACIWHMFLLRSWSSRTDL